MQAFHNDPAIKACYLARVRAHRMADEIIHGTYWEHGKGCASGCTVHSADRAAYERELGIPRVLAYLEDTLFEALIPPDDMLWPERFLEAIPVGADLALVWPQFALCLLRDPVYGVEQYVQEPRFADKKAAIATVVALYEEWAQTGTQPASASASAPAAAAAAAGAAAAYVPAAPAAPAAVIAAKRVEVRRWQGETLLRLLREAPIPRARESSGAAHC